MFCCLLVLPPACGQSVEEGRSAQATSTQPGWNIPTPPALPQYPSGSVVKASVPIVLDGGGGVTDTGAASYSLPLWIPEGPRGMQPKLALTYNGGGGNGWLGSGMSLAGLSAIAPCKQTFASEGQADGPDYDDRDSYCLDGMKLVEVGGSYRTELESFAKIVAQYGPGTNQPTGFVVHDRDGGTRTYEARYAPQHAGVSETAVALDPDPRRRVAFIYTLSRSEDRSGNRIDYTYESTDATVTGDAAYRPKTISYSYAGGVNARRRIEFLYESRGDDLIRYQRGVKLVTRSRIKTIKMWAPNPTSTENVWSYKLTYAASADTKATLLSTVQLCTANNSCSHVRSFTWSTANETIKTNTLDSEAEFDSTSLSMSSDFWQAYFAPGATHNWVPSTDVRILLFDADNDGDDDAIYRTQPTLVETSLYDTTDLWLMKSCSIGRIRFRVGGEDGLSAATGWGKLENHY